MGYARIIILLKNRTWREGVRRFEEPMNIDNIKKHATKLAEEVFGRDSVEYALVFPLPADDPSVVALILAEKKRSEPIPSSDGTHPFVRDQQRKPTR